MEAELSEWSFNESSSSSSAKKQQERNVSFVIDPLERQQIAQNKSATRRRSFLPINK